MHAEKTLQASREEALRQREQADSLRIRAEGPDLFRQLTIELDLNVRYLEMAGARGEIANISARGELHVRVSVTTITGHRPKNTYTDLFYREGSDVIRTLTLEGNAVRYILCIANDEKLMVLADNQTTPMSAKIMAETVVRNMLNIVG